MVNQSNTRGSENEKAGLPFPVIWLPEETGVLIDVHSHLPPAGYEQEVKPHNISWH